MRHRTVIGAMLTLIGLFACAAIYLMQMRAAALAHQENFSAWSPDAAAIRRALRADRTTQASEPLNKGDHGIFQKLFQSRFRDHEPQVAIGLHFLNRHKIKLMCPARMEPWYMDSIALAAWHEAQDDFGVPFQVDIYATYIGMPPIKIGQLRTPKDRPQFAVITYFPPHLRGTP